MKSVIIDAHGKINLSLDVVGLLPNGYHELVSIMQTVGLKDRVKLSPSDEGIHVKTSAEEIADDKTNIAYKAAALLFEKFDIKSGVEISIEKNIPIAAGMAGGSADGAAVLVGINELFELGIKQEELEKLGASIGADIPFCIRKGTVLCKGIGEIMTDLKAMPECTLLIAKPPINVSTKWAYGEIDKTTYEHPDTDAVLEGISRGDLQMIADNMGNVFEMVAAKHFREINDIKKIMTDYGALNAMMSGSGPTVFGIYNDKDLAEAAKKELDKAGIAKFTAITDVYNK